MKAVVVYNVGKDDRLFKNKSKRYMKWDEFLSLSKDVSEETIEERIS